MSVVASLRGITVRYDGRPVLRDVDLDIEQGTALVVVGASGAGKSTLLGVLNGTVEPHAGELSILGRDMRRASAGERRRIWRQVGTVHQDLRLVDSLRVIHNVNAGHLNRWSTLRALYSLLRPLETSRARQVLDGLGIGEKVFDKTATLSGGQQQRVALARVLVQDPAILVADEPISSLDRQASQETMNLLRELSRTQGKTTVISCHDLQFARTHFDRLIGLQNGQIVLDIAASALREGSLAVLYPESRPLSGAAPLVSLPSGRGVA